MDNRVFAVRCPSYDQAEKRLSELLEMMGGIGAFVAQGEKIVLKANLLAPAAPAKAVTTHPSLVKAVGRMVTDTGASPTIADSPGSGYKYTPKNMQRIYRVCELTEPCEQAGIKLNFDTSAKNVSFPDGRLIKRFEVITPVTEADGVLNLCKLKTHLFMHMTGAVKNSFGVIPGLTKPGYHAKLKDTARFADMLLDLSNFVAPRLSVMDAVVAMEGQGPNSGSPRHVGLILAAASPLALDVVAGEILGIDPARNPLLAAAARRGMGPTRIQEIELIGLARSELRVPGFQLPDTLGGETGLGPLPWWQQFLRPLFKEGMSVKPVIHKKACVACGACRDSCPMDAITLQAETYAQIDDSRCIRCYCCHEMCQYNAVALHKSLLYRLVRP